MAAHSYISKPIGGEKEAAFNTASLQSVEHHTLDVSEVTAADPDGDPESGTHFQGAQHPNHPLLCSHKGPDLVGLKFMDHEVSQHPIIEPFGIPGCRFKPAGDCSPGHPLDSGHGRDGKTMDTRTDDFIEQRPGLMQPIIRSAVSRREGPTALLATVPPPSALRGDVEGVSNDVAFASPASQGAIGVGTGASGLLAPLHRCLMAENEQEIQLESCVAGLLETINNSSVMKHRNLSQGRL